MSVLQLFREAVDYMYPKPKFRPVPKQIINQYKLGNETTEDERLLMLLGKARSPQAARELLEQFRANSAYEVIQKLPKRRKRSFRSRLKQLIRKIDGHQPGDPYRCEAYKEESL